VRPQPRLREGPGSNAARARNAAAAAGQQARRATRRACRALRVARLVETIGRRLDELAPAPEATLGAVEREVDKDPARVRAWALHAADPRPSLGDFQQRLLDQVLGLGEVPDDQVCGSQEPIRAVGHEALEIGSAVFHLMG
jgi:hypothetical protein